MKNKHGQKWFLIYPYWNINIKEANNIAVKYSVSNLSILEYKSHFQLPLAKQMLRF